MATKPKQEVSVPEGTSVGFLDQRPEWAQGMGRGNENVGQGDIVLPRLEIVQSLSPIREEDPGAIEGSFFNSASLELLGDLVYIVPVMFKVEFNVWTIYNEGGGFHGSFATKVEAERRLAEVARDGTPREHLEVVDTPTHYCLKVKPDGSHEQIVVSMPKSKAKVSRRWNSAIQMGGGDRFSRVYKFSTFKDKNKKNQSFFNFVVSPAGFVPQALFTEAEKVYNMFKSSNVRADYTVDLGETEGAGMDGEGSDI
jgi:hypothetical protein